MTRSVAAAPEVAVALATAARLPSGMADTAALSAALADAGLAAQVRAWDDTETDWQQFALVVPHCTWDYLDRQQEFRCWLRACDRRGVLPNPLSLLDWSLDKAYLLELAAQGIAIPATMRFERGSDVSPARLRERFGRTPVVVKPSIGGGGHQVWRCSDPEEAATVAGTRLPSQSVLVQEFEPAVSADGEYSAVFVAGQLSHVVRKRPKDGDFRVHRRYGATRATVESRPWMVSYGHRVLSSTPGTPLYARLDFLLPRPGDPVLMELELLEPDLYLRDCPGAEVRFAAALAARARRLLARA